LCKDESALNTALQTSSQASVLLDTTEDIMKTQGLLQPDDRSCQLCGAKDSVIDPCFAHLTIFGGYPPKLKKGIWRNDGKTCFYCLAVYKARYYPRRKLTEMESMLGSAEDEFKKFHGFRNWLLAKIKESGNIKMRISWPSDSQVFLIQEDAVTWESPDDIYIPLEDYKGDLSKVKQGLDYHGRQCAIVPESNNMRRKKTHTEKAQFRRLVDDGSMQIGEGHMEAKFADVSGIVMDRAGPILRIVCVLFARQHLQSIHKGSRP
jgi:hypothetical protein